MKENIQLAGSLVLEKKGAYVASPAPRLSSAGQGKPQTGSIVPPPPPPQPPKPKK